VRESPWAEPDYTSIPGDADLPMDKAELQLVWPGPALIMPAGLLPDGQPYSGDTRDNASRICGVEVRNSAEADAVVWAYWGQQNALRNQAGLPRPRRTAPRFELEDLPETLKAIEQLHREERARRRRQDE
jgi:hypothetical protein